MPDEFRDAEDVKEIILLQYPFTIVDEQTGEAIEYKGNCPSGETSPVWIAEKGSGGSRGLFIGSIFEGENFRTSAKSPPDDNPSLLLFSRLWSQLQFPGDLADLHVTTGKGSANAKPSSDVAMGKRANSLVKDVAALEVRVCELEAQIKALLPEPSELPF